ncbi:MAG: cyclic nucleotide-binding domain-containing protein [Gammaproteobacteria bacterium]|nr:cyclic nucleotide-binding domain-containing protein [Gammaproteobacteria bacterium]MDH5661205.1 cyclic nucleotide-binding domain-containing protein [Gammaproteobacteria bacterium]
MDFHKFLQTVPDFSDLTNEQLSVLEQSMLVSTYPDGYEFFSEKTRGDKVYLIIEGNVSVTHNRGKKCGFLEIKRHHPGEWFGIVSVIDNDKHVATCTSIGETKVATLPAMAFLLLYDSNAPLAHKIHYSINNQIIKDYRALVETLRNVLFAINEGKDYQAILNQSLPKYDGPERRA